MSGLSLTRRVGDQILIGPEIVITVTDLDHGQVRLRIAAPAELRINRRDREDVPS